MNLTRHNIICLDLETLHSADDCRHCGQERGQHYSDEGCEAWEGEKPRGSVSQFSAIGWERKLDLGLSIGAYWDYHDDQMHFFDNHTLEATVRLFVERQPLPVSFNGISFDFALMRALLRHFGESTGLTTMPWLCDTFKALCATSYDILREIWRADPGRKFERGLNSLGAISMANGLGAKEMDGATAPRLWAQGRHAEVVSYCQSDVQKTKGLFELICAGQPILRGDGLPILLPVPTFGGV